MTTKEETQLRNHLSYLRGKVIELHERCSGRSTRLIDKYVQEIYGNQGQWVEISDHYSSPKAAVLLAEHIMRRIAIEHQSDHVRIDKSKGYPKIMLVTCQHDYVHGEIERLKSEIEEVKAKLERDGLL